MQAWAQDWLRFKDIALVCVLGLAVAAPVQADGHGQTAPVPVWSLSARVVATGLPGANGIRQVGRFHSGGPFTANPEFLLQTQPGKVLDPERVLVTVSSNLGAPLANAAHAAGTVLSIDTRPQPGGQPLAIRADFGLHAAQARKAHGPVQIYTAQSPAYLNLRYNAGARTARFTAASGPRYLSINNAFGRPWIANAPFGLTGDGTESVVDPDGSPLANAPSDPAGGVFAGNTTPRESVAKEIRNGLFASRLNYRPSGQLTPGFLGQGVFGTALLGASPDGSGFAVFAAATGAGAVVQIHVQDGVDGLAPPGTIAVGADDPGVIGITFKWNPRRVLYLADGLRNRIVLLHLTDDTRQFKVERVSPIDSPLLHHPVDLAAAIPEIANPRFASHTTLAGGSDLYVANRGDGSLLRISQDGKVIARAHVEVPGVGRVGAGQLRSIAVSGDAQRLWLIVQQPGAGPDANNLLIEVPAFDGSSIFAPPPQLAAKDPGTGRAQAGEIAFGMSFAPQNGLGPLFNAPSCVACHPGPGGASESEEHFARRVARLDPVSGRVIPIDGQSSQSAPRFSTRDLGQLDAPAASLPRLANVVSLRMPLSLFAAGRIDTIPDAVIEAQAVSKGDGIKGRVHYLTSATGERRVGRFGWKADAATLDAMVAEAFASEMGINSALARHPQSPVEDDGTLVRSVSDFLRSLRRPAEAAK